MSVVRRGAALASALALALAFAAGCGIEAREKKSVHERQQEQLRKLAARTEERRQEAAPRMRSGGPAANAVDGVFHWPDPGEARPVAALRVDGLGTLWIALYPEIAPRTVERFTELAAEGFFDGLTFHRVIPGFVVQTGDPNTRNADPRDDGKGGSGQAMPDELSDAPHVRGAVSMANRGTEGTADSQFFVTLADRRDLDGRYTVFGRVVAGMEVADAIARVETDTVGLHGPPHRPRQDVRIERLTIERAVPAEIAAREGGDPGA